MLQKRMHGRPLKLINGLPSVCQGKIEGEVVLVAHRRRVARDSRRCKFLGSRAILHHEGVKYIIPLGKEEAHAVKVGPSEGNQSKGAKERRESECPIGAMTTGNGWHPDPDEQSGHVLV